MTAFILMSFILAAGPPLLVAFAQWRRGRRSQHPVWYVDLRGIHR